ncbi:hypothetical protein MD588_19730 [Photobacterium sp. SDRW27]|uniref:hypothetical protein n=1 Tax=Photobacterium obscurum TaxID=2829490 RepID=UPI0022439574|nr:hypothetical protein [Photobacterium obscurum]MCW8331028.1 hypothetical protein [Photobacterium obscurum]
MKNINTQSLIAFTQSVLHTLVSVIFSCVCIEKSNELTVSNDVELDEIASNYNKFYVKIGGCIRSRIQSWSANNLSCWKQDTHSRAKLVKTLFLVISRSHLYFSKSVSAIKLVGFYRHAPADARYITALALTQNIDTNPNKSLVFNTISSNHLTVVAAFFVPFNVQQHTMLK